MHFFGLDLTHVLQTYGYWAVFGLVLLETTGIPAPGETMLIAAAAYAGATHHLSIFMVIGVAVGAATLGDNAGFWIGREGGWRLLCRYRHVLHIEPYMLKVGVYVFRRRYFVGHRLGNARVRLRQGTSTHGTVGIHYGDMRGSHHLGYRRHRC